MDDKPIGSDPFATKEYFRAEVKAGLPPTRVVGDSETGRKSSGLEVRCPSCHEPTEVAADTTLTDLTCSVCGSHFSLVDQSKATQLAPSLSKLGRFELIERLGVGGFGSVWKARDKTLDRTVAIKIPRAGGMNGDEQEKFFREARAAAQLRHPNIVSVHEVGRDGDSLYIVSDYVRGATLGDWRTGQQLTNREAAELCAKIADALHHAHEQGIVHRDLKPANIMMDSDNQPHLMDFGLARREVGEITVTVDGQVLGTPAYMSPEQAQGEAHTADRRSDVYSLGVTFFQLLTGELPFRGNTRMLIKQVIDDEPPSPRKLNSNVPKDLETITLKCLEKDPAKRYQTANEFSDECRRYLSGDPIYSRPISRIARTWRWCKRKPAAALLGVLTFGIVLALGVGGPLVAVRESNRRKTALDQALAAEEAQRTAQEARNFAELERDNAKRQSYRASLSAAKASIITKDYAEARALLSGTEANRRGWEWRHLSRLADPSNATIKSDDARRWRELWYDRQANRFLTYSQNNLVAIDPLTCKRSTIYEGLRNSGSIAAVDRTGKFLIEGSSSLRYALRSSAPDWNFHVVDVKNRDRITKLEPFKTDIEGFAISAGLGLVAGLPVTDYRERKDDEKLLPIWDLSTGRLVRVIGPDMKGFLWACFDDERGNLFTLSTHRLDQTTFSEGKLIGLRKPDKTTVRVDRLTELGEEGTARAELKVWDPRTGQLLGFVDDLIGIHKPVALDQATGNLLVRKRFGWNIYGPKLGRAISQSSSSANGVKDTDDAPQSIDFKNAEEIVVGLSSGRVVVVQVDGSKIHQEFLGAPSVQEVAIDPESGTIAALSPDSIRIWNPDDDRSNPRKFLLGGVVDDVELAPNLGLMFAAYQGSTFEALELEWGTDVWKGRSREITSIAIEQQSSVLALGTKDGKVHFVNKDGKELRTTSAVSAEVSALVWSNDGRTLAVGSSCGEIVLMDSQDMRVLMRKTSIDNTVSKFILDNSRGVLFVGYDTNTLDISKKGGRTSRSGSSESRIFCFDIETGDAKWCWPIDAFQERLRTVPESIRASVSEALRGSHQMSITGSTKTSSRSKINLKNTRTGEEWSWECADSNAWMSPRSHQESPRVSDLRLMESRGFVCAAMGGSQLVLLDAQNGHQVWSWPPDRTLDVYDPGQSAIAVIENPERLVFADNSSQLHVLEPLKDEPLAKISSASELSARGVIALDFDAATDSLYACAEGYHPFVMRWETVRSDEVQTNSRRTQGVDNELLRPSIHQLRKLVGKQQTVEFRIQAVGGIKRRYLNSKANYRHPNCFTVIVESDQVPALALLSASDPVKELPGKIVRVTGKIEERGGQLFIDVTDPATQLKLVDSAEAGKSETKQ